MWKLNTIKATNLCAFKNLEYQVSQNRTTLIFGNNMDNDSQGSNGSGKSAMLEAIAIGLTGETLRKIKMEEIINDAETVATVELILYNDSLGEYLRINRTISRKSAQVIELASYRNPDGSDAISIEQATVSDYNKCVLDMLGLSKDDLFSNYVLSKHKFSSFLSSSDREKKEIINRFSNGIMVDESIAAIQADLQPIESALRDAEKEVATCEGVISALDEQINQAITSSTERVKQNEERITNFKNAITEKRAYQRQQQEIITCAKAKMNALADIEDELSLLEEKNQSVSDSYKFISAKFTELGLRIPRNYATIAEQNYATLHSIQSQYEELEKLMSQYETESCEAKENYNAIHTRYEKFESTFESRSVKLTDQISKLRASISKIEKECQDLNKQKATVESNIASLQTLLVGVITCPQCQHEFLLSKENNLEDVKIKIASHKDDVDHLNSTLADKMSHSEILGIQEKEIREDKQDLIDAKSSWSERLTKVQTKVDKVTRSISEASTKMSGLKDEMNKLQKGIDNATADLFDDSFAILDDAYKAQENTKKEAELNIETSSGAILSYESLIKEAESYSETDVTASMKAGKEKYEKDLALAIIKKEEVEQNIHSLKTQELTFVEFKTHLANSKINALNHITNEFLEGIGSDIRISLSGYTILKSGKVRDKISISLIRGGIDCGSFDKFSEGEKARVNLANILAMNKLTNINCDDDKGLNLLVLDEILEATDEQGLTNIFNALNQLKITALVVSHGNTAENYPYKTVVNKLNGVSFINELNTQQQ